MTRSFNSLSVNLPANVFLYVIHLLMDEVLSLEMVISWGAVGIDL
jgi:hypothetical protein